MLVKVVKEFRDIHTGEIHEVGDMLEITEERYGEILHVGDFVYLITADAPANTSGNSSEIPNSSSNDEAETPKNDAAPFGDGFDIMSVRELKEYADVTYKLTFKAGTKKSEIIAKLRELEQNK